MIAASSAWELPGRSFASPLRLAAMGAIAAEPGWGGVLRGCGRFCGRRRSVCARGGATVAEVTADDRGGYRGGDGGGEEADAERVREGVRCGAVEVVSGLGGKVLGDGMGGADRVGSATLSTVLSRPMITRLIDSTIRVFHLLA